MKVEVYVHYLHCLQIEWSPYSLQAGGLHSTEMRSCSHTALMDLRIAQNIRIEFRSYQCGGFGIYTELFFNVKIIIQPLYTRGMLLCCSNLNKFL